MRILPWAGAMALGLAAPLCAQHATQSNAPAGYAPEVAPVVLAATSTPLMGIVTSTSATPTSGACSFAGGIALCGPFAPQLGRPVRVVLRVTGTLAFTFMLGTSTDNCATINPLTASGTATASFGGPANELVDEAWLAGVAYCAQVTGLSGSGTLSYAVRQ